MPPSLSARRLRIGSANAAVFPVPVAAWQSKSYPAIMAGIARCWMGVGASYPRSARQVARSGAIPRAAKSLSLVLMALVSFTVPTLGPLAESIPPRRGAVCTIGVPWMGAGSHMVDGFCIGCPPRPPWLRGYSIASPRGCCRTRKEGPLGCVDHVPVGSGRLESLSRAWCCFESRRQFLRRST